MKGIARKQKRNPTPTEKRRALVTVTAVFLCGVLFLFSAGDKIKNQQDFRIQVAKSPILTGHEDIVVWAVPIVEIVIAALMIVPLTRQVGLYGFYTVMLAFTGYIVMLLNGAERPPCGCNALTEAMSLEWHAVMNGLFSALAATAIILNEKKPPVPVPRPVNITNANGVREMTDGNR